MSGVARGGRAKSSTADREVNGVVAGGSGGGGGGGEVKPKPKKRKKGWKGWALMYEDEDGNMVEVKDDEEVEEPATATAQAEVVDGGMDVEPQAQQMSRGM